MKSTISKRSIIVRGHKTSVSLEDAFWNALKELAGGDRKSLSDVVSAIDAGRKNANLSSAIRVHLFDHFRVRPVTVAADHSQASAEAGV